MYICIEKYNIENKQLQAEFSCYYLSYKFVWHIIPYLTLNDQFWKLQKGFHCQFLVHTWDFSFHILDYDSWGSWQSWTACTATCGWRGVRTRKRACLNQNGKACPGTDVDYDYSCADRDCANSKFPLSNVYQKTIKSARTFWPIDVCN